MNAKLKPGQIKQVFVSPVIEMDKNRNKALIK